jgi:multidrug resistance efflux pump
MAVDVGTPVLSMWLGGDSWVEAWVREEELAAVAEGGSAEVTFPYLPGQRFAARVSKVGLATDFEMPADYLPQPRSTRMRPTPQVGIALELLDEPPLLRPGVSAVVSIDKRGAE